MSWTAYLAPIEQVSAGSAIISQQGAHCGHKGDWKASQAEEVNFANIFKNPSSYAGKSLNYSGKKYMINRALDDMVMAQAGKEGLILQKSKTVIVCAHYVEGQVAGNVSAKVDHVVRQLVENNC